MRTNTKAELTQPKAPLFMFRGLSALASGSSHLTLKALPTLLTDCVILGHAEKADVVFTPPQWFAMCAHMMNNNPQNFFLMPYIEDGKPKFAKAYNVKASERVAWAWDTITGKAKQPASIGFYPTNSSRQTRWGAMDFDIHDDDRNRARDFAHKAFALLFRHPQLYVALTTSAGDPQYSGWHLFIFTEEFYPVEEWTRLLKQVASQIDAPIQSGVCEIFPDDCRGIGHGIRAPGTWNPKNGECGLILQETVTKLLTAPKESNASLYALGAVPREETRLPLVESFLGVSTGSGQGTLRSQSRKRGTPNSANWWARPFFNAAGKWLARMPSYSTTKLVRRRSQHWQSTSLNLTNYGQAWSESGLGNCQLGNELNSTS